MLPQTAARRRPQQQFPEPRRAPAFRPRRAARHESGRPAALGIPRAPWRRPAPPAPSSFSSSSACRGCDGGRGAAGSARAAARRRAAASRKACSSALTAPTWGSRPCPPTSASSPPTCKWGQPTRAGRGGGTGGRPRTGSGGAALREGPDRPPAVTVGAWGRCVACRKHSTSNKFLIAF